MPDPLEDLTEKQKAFCREYIFDWNGGRAYSKAYGTSGLTSRVNASKLLTNTNIQQYIKSIQNNLEENAVIAPP